MAFFSGGNNMERRNQELLGMRKSYCSMCNRPIKADVGHLIKGNGVIICEDCLARDEEGERVLDIVRDATSDITKAKQVQKRSGGTMEAFEFLHGGYSDRQKKELMDKYDIKDPALINTGNGEYILPKKSDKPEPKFLRPVEIKERLDEYVVGQEKAKMLLSTAVYNHYKRLEIGSDIIEKSNILLVGPTGSGKTFLVQTLAKILDVPLAIADATTLTEAGYIGDDVESVLTRLLAAAEGNELVAERGIVFIDEVDKLAHSSSKTNKEVGGKGVQQALLKLLEGNLVNVPTGQKEPFNASKCTTRINTKNILFICGGAFPEAEAIIKRRLSSKGGMGFGAVVAGEADEKKDNLLTHINTDDLREFGMIPEFLGRLPVIASLEDLTVDTLKRILTEPKNAIIKQYQMLMEYDCIRLSFEDDALAAIAEKAIERNTGARSLRAILEEVLNSIMFYMPTDMDAGEIVITREYVEGTGEFKVLKGDDFGLRAHG